MQLTIAQIESHIRAAKKLDKIKDEAFEFIRVCKNKTALTEYDVQQFILKRFREEGLTSGKMRPIVAINNNSRDPHYTPTLKKKNSVITNGSLVMIDLWAKEKGRNGIYADITWMGCIKDNKKTLAEVENKLVEYKRIFKIVIGARDEVIKFIGHRLKEKRGIKGLEADEIARNYISKYGYGKNFIHSTGHSLDKNVHGSGVSFSSVKKKGHKLARKKDRRKILSNMPFTIEPGIYLDDFGARSEIDAYIDEKNKLVITTEVQKKILEV